MNKFKTAFIIVLFNTPISEKDRLKKEIKDLKIKNYKIYFVNNTKVNRGFAAGVNIGIKKGLKDNCDLYIVANPDISFVHLRGVLWQVIASNFDIWGFAMKQNNKVYYGGEIDKWALTGGLIKNKPNSRFSPIDFASGSLMCFKKNVIDKIGYFDEKYFMYYEDVDYCLRAKKAGFKVGIDSQTIYEHFETSGKNPQKEILLYRARQIFLRKNGTLTQKTYNFVNRIFKSPFLMNFMSLNISSVAIKLLNFIHFIFLIRYLNASEYGIYTLVWAQVMLLSPLVDFGTTSYGIVHLATEKKTMLKSLLDLRLVLSVLIFSLTVILSVLFFRTNTKIYLYILITSTVIFTNTFSGSYFILNALRNKLYKSSRNSIIFNVVIITLSITSLVIWKRLLIIFLITFIGYNLYSLINIILIRRELGSFSFRLSFPDWKNILKQSYIYVLISFFGGLYFKIDVFLLQAIKGIHDVGIYSAGYKFFEALLFLAASYNMTATPTLSRIVKNKYELFGKLVKDTIFLITLGILVVIFIQLFAPFLLPLIFKTSFIPSIQILQIVIFTLPFILINSLFMNLLYVLQKAKYVIYVFIVQTIINICLNLFLIPKYTYFGSAWVTVISEIINFVFLLLICRIVWNKVFNIKTYGYQH